MISYTKGTWTARQASDGSYDVGIIADDKHVIGEAYAAIRHAGEVSSNEAKANGQLFAASKELYEALVLLVNDGSTKENIERARQAIAKAEGLE